MFMSGNGAEAKTAAKATTGVGKEDDLSGLPGGAPLRRAAQKKGAAGAAGGLGGLLGGLIPGGAGGAAGGAGATGIGGLLGGGGKTENKAPETMVAATAGSGASSGLPTCSDSGEITMTFRQVRFLHATHLNCSAADIISSVDQPGWCWSFDRRYRPQVGGQRC